MPKTVKEIAKFIGGEVVGDGDVEIGGVSGINEAREGDISFILNAQYENLVAMTKATCVVVPKDIKGISSKTVIKVDNPSIAFSKIIELILPEKIPHPRGIHPGAIVSKKARLGQSVSLGPYVVIEDGASIGDNTILYPFSYVGKNTKIGKDCIIYPNVTIREEISVGDRVVIHAGSVVGSDGFGYDTRKDGSHVKIPQLGVVIIEDDVELGACVTVDRARFARTVIGRGSKIDNLVQIAHNVIIGPHCLIAAQTGIAGSTELGRNVVFGGQVGVADHVKLGDFVMASAQCGISKSYPANTVLFGGMVAKPIAKAKELIGCIGILPRLYERVRALEAKIKELESGKTKDS
jgi:UDP-3-O-[3-hydroxymyristoyl] glucosamine N-acyltransferase